MSQTPERKAALAAQRKQHAQDRKDAAEIERMGIYAYPLNLPSLHRAIYGDRRPRFLTTGFDWIDKPHRVAHDASEEIRALRRYILTHIKPADPAT